jgi:MoxR-like ATPase
MKKYRFKTEEEFKKDKLWHHDDKTPIGWAEDHAMNKYLGDPIDEKYNEKIELKQTFSFETWCFQASDCIEFIEVEDIPLEEIITKLEEQKQNSLITKEKTMKNLNESVVSSAKDKFVFMDKTVQVLEIGFNTSKNIVLYGPGGHGKSEMTLEFLKERNITPYVITMGTGMTGDRLFGGMDIKEFHETGKIEYLVENSFMNHEYVVFEEMFDAPDFILEQLKDILSSGIFRNGTQTFTIKTKFIICCTNRTRDEFSKNMSLKALMERFPLELNVIWDNYTEISYNKLLESKFGVDNVDPVIPYLLQEYAKNGITISPRIAVTAYMVYDQCGPEALSFIAEFTKKPSLIAEAINKFESTIKFRNLSASLSNVLGELTHATLDSKDDEVKYKSLIKELDKQLVDIQGLIVGDDVVHLHTSLVKGAKEARVKFAKNLTIASFV